MVIETDRNEDTKIERQQHIAREMRDAATDKEQELAHKMDGKDPTGNKSFWGVDFSFTSERQ